MCLKYYNYVDTFLSNVEIDIIIHKYTIGLMKSKKLSYEIIFSSKLFKLEISKTDINIYWKFWFISHLKSSACINILCNKKLNKKFYLYINY